MKEYMLAELEAMRDALNIIVWKLDLCSCPPSFIAAELQDKGIPIAWDVMTQEFFVGDNT